jgi:hypothetical protein
MPDQNLAIPDPNAGALVVHDQNAPVSAAGPLRHRRVRRDTGALLENLSANVDGQGRIVRSTAAAVDGSHEAILSSREAVLTTLTEIDGRSSLRLDDISQRIQTLEISIQTLENRAGGFFKEQDNRFTGALQTQGQEQDNKIAGAFQAQEQEITRKFELLNGNNQAHVDEVKTGLEHQMQQIQASLEDIKAQQRELSGNFGRLAENTTRALEITEQLANQATEAERRAEAVRDETRRDLIELRATRQSIADLVRTLGDQQAASISEVARSVQQLQGQTISASATSSGHVAQIGARLDDMHLDSNVPSTSRPAVAIVQVDGETAPQSFSMERWVSLKVPADRVETVKALGAREFDESGAKRYSAPPGTELMPLEEYWSDPGRRMINEHIVQSVGLQVPVGKCSFVRADAAADIGLNVRKEGMLVSTKDYWAPLKVPRDKVAAAKALGVEEYPDNFNGGLRYTVRPGTDLMPLKEYWSDAVKREYSLCNPRERSLSTR